MDRQHRWYAERLAYLQRLAKAAKRRGDTRTLRRFEQEIQNILALME